MSYLPGSHKIGYAIRKGIFDKKINYQPYWSVRDFKKIVLDNKSFFDNFLKNPEIIDNFLKQSKIIENDANKEHFGYTAKAGTAIVFDEGGVHKGSRPQQNDRMVLRYLYSSKN